VSASGSSSPGASGAPGPTGATGAARSGPGAGSTPTCATRPGATCSDAGSCGRSWSSMSRPNSARKSAKKVSSRNPPAKGSSSKGCSRRLFHPSSPYVTGGPSKRTRRASRASASDSSTEGVGERGRWRNWVGDPGCCSSAGGTPAAISKQGHFTMKRQLHQRPSQQFAGQVPELKTLGEPLGGELRLRRPQQSGGDGASGDPGSRSSAPAAKLTPNGIRHVRIASSTVNSTKAHWSRGPMLAGRGKCPGGAFQDSGRSRRDRPASRGSTGELGSLA